MLGKSRLKNQSRKRSAGKANAIAQYDVNQRIQYYMNFTRKYLQSPQKSLRHQSLSASKLPEVQARVKVLEEENTALRESAKLLDEFRGKAEERKQIMKQLYLILKEKETLEAKAKSSFAGGLQDFLIQLDSFEHRLNEELLIQNRKIEGLEKLLSKKKPNEEMPQTFFLKSEVSRSQSENSLSFRQVKSEQESSIMLTGKADLQQEIIKWVRSEFGEDVGEGNLMEFLKKSISKNPFPELSQEADEVLDLRKALEQRTEEIKQLEEQTKQLECKVQASNEISEFNQQILEQNQALLKEIDLKNDEIANQSEQLMILSSQYQQLQAENAEKIEHLNSEIQTMTNDYALKCEELEDAVGQLETQEDLVGKKQLKLIEMKKCMELQKRELQSVFLQNQEMDQEIQKLTEGLKRQEQSSSPNNEIKLVSSPRKVKNNILEQKGEIDKSNSEEVKELQEQIQTLKKSMEKMKEDQIEEDSKKQGRLILSFIARDVLREHEDEIEPLKSDEIQTEMNQLIHHLVQLQLNFPNNSRHIQELKSRSSELSNEILKLLGEKDDLSRKLFSQDQVIKQLEQERKSLSEEFKKLARINQVLPSMSSRTEIDECYELSNRSMSNEADGLRQAVKLLQKELDKAKKHIISLENEVDQDEEKIQRQLKLLKEEVQHQSVENTDLKKQLAAARKQLIDSESGAKLEHMNALITKFFSALLAEYYEESQQFYPKATRKKPWPIQSRYCLFKAPSSPGRMI